MSMNMMNATELSSEKLNEKLNENKDNIIYIKKNLKNKRISNIYKDEMTDLQLNDEITFDYETKKNIQGGIKIKIEKITPKYINSYKKENMKNIKKIDNKIETDLDEEDKEESEDEMEQQHQEQMEMYGYSKCAYCEKELPNDQIGQDADGDNICIECNNAKESDDEEEDEGTQEDDEETQLILAQQKITEKLAEIKYKKEAGERKEKVVEWLRKVKADELECEKKQIEELKDKLAQKELLVSKLEEDIEKEDDELLGGMNVDAVYETITKKKTTPAKKSGKKTCVSKGDKRLASKVLNDKERITMTGKWTEIGTYVAEYDKTDDMFYEVDASGNRITENNFENMNRWGNHIYKNHQKEYEGKKNIWSVLKLNRGGKWISMLDLPIIEE